MFKQSKWLAAVVLGAAVFGGLTLSAQPANAATIYTGYVNMYGGLYDTSNTSTNVSVCAYKTVSGFTGRISWTVKKTFTISPSATSIVFDSPSHMKMEGDVLFKGVNSHFTLGLSPAGATRWGTIGMKITSKADGKVLYSTGMATDGSVIELPMYSSSGSWLLRAVVTQ